MDTRHILFVFLNVWIAFPTANGIPTITISPTSGWEPNIPSTITLTCGNVNTTDGIQITWKRNNGPFRTSTYPANSITITSYSVAKHDGQFTCETPVDGLSAPQTLTIYAKPTVTVSPALTVTVNITQTLPIAGCTIRSKPRSTVVWNSLHSTLDQTPPRQNKQNKYTDVTRDLIWKAGTTEADRRQAGGSYTCSGTATAAGGPFSASARPLVLNIKYPPYDISFPDGTESVTVVEGANVTRTCLALCEPVCSYEWRDSLKRIISRSDELSLINVMKSDLTNYTCKASNIEGTETLIFSLTVKYAPTRILSLNVNPSNPKQGEQVNVTCVTDGNPAPTISFHNTSVNNSALYSTEGEISAVYAIQDVSCSSFSIWCSAFNEINNQKARPAVRRVSFINVQCAPQVYYKSVEEYTVTLKPKETLDIRVGLLANPYPGRRWFFTPKGSTNMSDLPDNVLVLVRDGNMEGIVVVDAQDKNIGAFTMTASNFLGEMNFTIEIQLSSGVDDGLVAGVTITVLLFVAIVVLAVVLFSNKCPLVKVIYVKEQKGRDGIKDVVLPNPYPETDNETSSGTINTSAQPNVYSQDVPDTSEPAEDESEPSTPQDEAYMPMSFDQGKQKSVKLYTSLATEQRPSTPKLTQQRPSTPKLTQQRPSTPKLTQQRPSTPNLAQQRPSTPNLAQQRPSTPKLPPAKANPNNKPKMTPKPIKPLKNGSVISKALIADGSFYKVHNAVPAKGQDLPKSLVVKITKTTKDALGRISWEYMKDQAECLKKLSETNLVPRCHGIIHAIDQKWLVMSSAPTGRLRDYIVHLMTYENLESRALSVELGRILYHVVSAVVTICNAKNPSMLFYCLSADHVLLTDQKMCQVTGFASADAVRAREQWEHDNKASRPSRWLAPEAIELNHVPESEIWSLGVLIWEIYNFGEIPRKDISDEEVANHVMCGRRLPKPTYCNKVMYDLLVRCWQHEPHRRVPLAEIYAVCQEPEYYENA